MYLKTFVDESKSADDVKRALIEISNKNPALIQKIEKLKRTYSKQIKRESLQKELEKLDK
jgi:hypothetical protein